MQGTITRTRNRRYVVICDGLDPATARERHRLHPPAANCAAVE